MRECKNCGMDGWTWEFCQRFPSYNHICWFPFGEIRIKEEVEI
jgi:hypothetical protein